MKKQILFVINSLGIGGAEKSLTSLLNLMDFDRYDVDLLMFNPGGMFLKLLPGEVNLLPQPAYLRWCAEGGLNLRYMLTRFKVSIGIRSNPQCGGKSLHDAQKYWKFAADAFDSLEKQYDAAIAWGQGNPTHFVTRKVQARRKVAVINADFEAVGHNREFDRAYYAQYDHIASVSDLLYDKMRQVYPEMQDKMTVLYDIRNQKLMELMARAEVPYEKKNGTTIFVTVGRMVQPKGYDLAVEAAEVLWQRGLSFRWYLVGDGPERSTIEKLIDGYNLREYVVCVGAKENPYPYIRNADIYVQTSRFEGFCLTLSEARALCVPPVSTDFDVVHDQLRHEENGLIAEITPESIADNVQRLMEDKALYQRIKDNLAANPVGNEDEIEKLYKMIEG